VSSSMGPARSVLLVSAVTPVPLDNGKRVVLAGLLDYFVNRLGGAAVHYALVGDCQNELPILPYVVHRLQKPSALTRLGGGARRLMWDREGTLQEAMLSSSKLKTDISTLILQLKPELVVYDTVRLAQHAPAELAQARSVVYLDDLFSVRYERILDQTASARTTEIDPLGEFASNVPSPLRRLVRRPAVHRPLLRFEQRRMLRRELHLATSFSTCLLVSPEETRLLRERSGALGVQTMTPLLPECTKVSRRMADPSEFVFLGRLNIPHNDDAICSFLAAAVDGLRAACPSALVRVLGRDPSPTLLRLASQNSDVVRIEGYVEDLDAVFGRAAALLAPLRFGGGIKIKVLDALARGLPVLATSVAAEGIPMKPDGADGCIVANDLRTWPNALAAMVSPLRNADLSRSAVHFFTSTYSRSAVMAQYDELFLPGI